MRDKKLQNATEEAEFGLTGAQLRVLQELAGGATVVAASRAASIDRTTVHRWLKNDYQFRAALNALHRTFYETTRTRLHTLVDSAIGVVTRHLEGGDLRAALAVLRGTGVLSDDPPKVGPDSPREILDDDILADGERFKREGDRVAARFLRLPELPPDPEAVNRMIEEFNARTRADRHQRKRGQESP